MQHPSKRTFRQDESLHATAALDYKSPILSRTFGDSTLDAWHTAARLAFAGLTDAVKGRTPVVMRVLLSWVFAVELAIFASDLSKYYVFDTFGYSGCW